MLTHTAHGIHDFERALRRGRWRAFLAWLRGIGRRLPSLEEVRAGRPTVATQPSEAPQEIDLGDVVGTVFEARSRDFGAGFMPLREHDAERWIRVLAAIEWQGLPPIRVHRFEGRYYVEDGHHRVSVMRALKLRRIEAYVTDVRAVGGPPTRARTSAAPCGRECVPAC